MIADHDELEASVAAYVLGALDDDEARQVRRHLATCPTCPALAEDLRRAVGSLPLAVEPVAPSAGLRDRILTAAGATVTAPKVRPREPAVLPLRRTPGRDRTRWRPAVAAAAALIAFALGAGLGLGIGRTTVPPQAAGVNQFSMTGTGDMAGAKASVFELSREKLTFVQFSGLPQIAPDRVYELWLIPTTGQPVPGALFAPDARGAQVVVLGRDLGGYKALAVTEEAAPDGAQAPTQQPQLAGTIT